MKMILFLQNLRAGEIIIIFLVVFFLSFSVRLVSAASSGRVLRKGNNRIFCGVCSGIADYLDMSSFWVRLLFLSTGGGVGLYLLLALLMRDQNS